MHRPSPEMYSAAAGIVQDAGGRIVGRTKLQKVAYLLELAGYGDGFEFEYRHYGPFSDNLADAMKMARAFNLVLEDERQTDWGGFYSIFSTPDGTIRRPDRAAFAQAAAKIGAVELELAATAAYLKVAERSVDPWEDTKRLKPEKATSSRLQAAKRAYRELRSLKTRKPLPEL